MTKKPNYRVLTPGQTDKILAAFEKAHGYFPLPKEAMRWAKSAEGRAVLDESVFYEEAPTDPREHKLKMAAIADSNDESITAGALTQGEIFARFDVVFGIIRGASYSDGFLRITIKGFSEVYRGDSSPDREITVSAINIEIDDVVPLLKKHGGETAAAIIAEHGEAGALVALARHMAGGTGGTTTQ